MDWMNAANNLWGKAAAWWKSIGSALAGSNPASAPPFVLRVQCNRCGEILEVRLNIFNDVSAEFDENGNPSGYSCRKIFQGNGRCFQRMEVHLTFDTRRRLKKTEILGGRMLPGASGGSSA
jgi:hypothetical protein